MTHRLPLSGLQATFHTPGLLSACMAMACCSQCGGAAASMRCTTRNAIGDRMNHRLQSLHQYCTSTAIDNHAQTGFITDHALRPPCALDQCAFGNSCGATCKLDTPAQRYQQTPLLYHTARTPLRHKRYIVHSPISKRRGAQHSLLPAHLSGRPQRLARCALTPGVTNVCLQNHLMAVSISIPTDALPAQSLAPASAANTALLS